MNNCNESLEQGGAEEVDAAEGAGEKGDEDDDINVSIGDEDLEEDAEEDVDCVDLLVKAGYNL